MTFENEDQNLSDKATGAGSKMTRQSRISYSREFLLSLSELEVCKKLPLGFDESILSEFVDASPSFQDRQRIHGNTPLQGFRRTEYGSSPPTRGEMGNYSRGVYGRWDNRSSGHDDRDLESQSDRDSDSGRRYGSQSSLSWQGPEHDGLLGSGSFPRPSGYGGGISSKNRPSDHYQLNRSNEPYHPPRPFKAAPLSRRDTSDSYNDETFGSTEITSEDRAEEERRRRASFEFMRKEQQKAMQGKQKVHLNKDTADSVSELLNDGREEKNVLDRNRKLDMTATESISSNDLGKSILPSQTTCRPLVPPGFTNLVTEKDSGLKSLSRSGSAEAGNNEAEVCLVRTCVVNSTSLSKTASSSENVGGQLSVDKQLSLPLLNKGEQSANSSMHLDSSRKTFRIEDNKHQASVFPEAHEVLDTAGMVDLNPNLSGLSLDGDFSHKILEKILGNALSVTASNSLDTNEIPDDKADDTQSLKASHSSKFACWFVEEERKTADDISSTSPNDLLSLLVGGNKGKLNDSDDKAMELFNREFSPRASEVPRKSITSFSSAANGVSESVPSSIKQEIVPSILTCEDLEQTILSEYSENTSNLWPHLEGERVMGTKSEWPTPHTDDHASQHLLSLLQKGATQENIAPIFHADAIILEKAPASDLHGLGSPLCDSVVEEAKNVQPPGKTLTLETLFGTAFMKELQSVEAPVSVQRGSAGSPLEAVGQQTLSSPVKENGVFSSATDQLGSEKTSNARTFFISNQRQQMPVDKTEKWMGYDDPLIGLNLSSEPAVASKTGGFHGAVDFQLPEEESLISAVNEDLKPQFSKFMPGGNLNQIESLASNAPGNIKIAKQLAAIEDERPAVGVDGSPFLRGLYRQQADRDNLYRDLHAETSTANFQSMQKNQGKPLLQQLDPHSAHANSHLKFTGIESMIQHDVSANEQFPANMLRPSFHQPSMGMTGFDRATHYPMLQQMQMHDDYPPHLVNDFQRGTPVPHQATGFIHEHNPLQGYPFRHGQPNMGDRGIPLPAPDVNGGTRHPEAFQRLVEMELRANSKRIPPFPVGHSPGIYGHELDILRYR